MTFGASMEVITPAAPVLSILVAFESAIVEKAEDALGCLCFLLGIEILLLEEPLLQTDQMTQCAVTPSSFPQFAILATELP